MNQIIDTMDNAINKLSDLKSQCNYRKRGKAIVKGTYDVRQEYNTDCGIRVANMLERVWNGTEAIRIKPNGKCFHCKKEITVIDNS